MSDVKDFLNEYLKDNFSGKYFFNTKYFETLEQEIKWKTEEIASFFDREKLKI